jgi:hypothetical protein
MRGCAVVAGLVCGGAAACIAVVALGGRLPDLTPEARAVQGLFGPRGLPGSPISGTPTPGAPEAGSTPAVLPSPPVFRPLSPSPSTTPPMSSTPAGDPYTEPYARLPVCPAGTHWSPGHPCRESPTAEWVADAPYPLQAALVASTAGMVTDLAPIDGTDPSLSSVSAFTDACQPYDQPVMTPSEFTWAWDTLYVDLILDDDNPDQAYYGAWVEDWARALNDMRVECSSPYRISPQEIARVEGRSFQAEVAEDITSFESAEQIHAAWRASQGSSDTWDQEWADAYLELVDLFQQLQGAG